MKKLLGVLLTTFSIGIFFIVNRPGSAAPTQTLPLLAGAAAVNITPSFEGRPIIPGKDPKWKKGDPFFDTGIDGLFDFEEPGALGPDGKPGKAGVDDDGNGLVDDCPRPNCPEYLAKGSDDVRDPDHDDYDHKHNRHGTEGDHHFEFVHLAGFSPYYPFFFIRNRLAAGVHDPIWSRALAIRGTNGVTTLLISNDLPGLGWKHINPVRRRLSREFDVPVGNIIIAATHDHAAPDAIGYWVTALKGHNKAYTDQLREWMYEAGAQALRSMRPARMKVITTTHYSCIDAKTGELKKDPDCHLPVAARLYHEPGGDQYDQELIQDDKRDPIVRNTRIVAAQFLDAASDATIGTFVDWNTHPDTLGSDNQLVSSDYPNYLRRYVEAKLGGIAVYFTGTLGCQIGSSGLPVPLWSEDMQRAQDENGKPILIRQGWERIRSLGYEVGWETVKALEAAPSDANVPVYVRTDTIDVRVDNFLHTVATGSVWTKNVAPEDAMVHYPGHCDSRWGCVPSDVSVLEIGDLGLVAAPGEVDPSYLLGRQASVVDYGKKFGKWYFPAEPGWDRWMPGKHHAVLGQANNYLSYLIHRPDNVGWWNFKHPNHYEEFVTVSKSFGDNTGDKIMEMLGSPERFTRAGAAQAMDPRDDLQVKPSRRLMLKALLELGRLGGGHGRNQ